MSIVKDADSAQRNFETLFKKTLICYPLRGLVKKFFSSSFIKLRLQVNNTSVKAYS